MNRKKLNELAGKMGLMIVDTKYNENISNKRMFFSKTLDISKPNRPEVKEDLQKQLEAIR